MKKAVHLNIVGRVQGVFFRQHTRDKAIELSISGWVRNRDDGSVELIAEGEEEALKIFVQWCHHGPERANVEEVQSKVIEVKNLIGFEVKR